MTSLPWLLAGGAVGALSGLSLRWTVAHLQPKTPARAVILAVGGTVLRWGVAAGLLIAALRRGAGPALVAFAGLWLARWVVVLWTYGVEAWRISSLR